MTTAPSLSAFLAMPLEPALERIRTALRDAGFGVLTEVDVQAVFQEKLATDFYPYRLLGACSPDVAYRALEIDPTLGTFLPCTIAVYDTGTGTEVHIQDPALALDADAPEEMRELIQTVRGRLDRVVESLAR